MFRECCTAIPLFTRPVFPKNFLGRTGSAAPKISVILLITLLATLLLSTPRSWAQNNTSAPVKIGVLAKQGEDQALRKWGPTASYLNQALPAYTFEIVPLDFDEVRLAAAHGTIDFLITNSAYYVSLEFDYGLSHIATMVNLLNHQPKHVYGGVIFTRTDRNDINNLLDLKGKSFAAVDRDSLGGWLMAWREMHRLGIRPDHDFKPLSFSATHDGVVMAVLSGKADAGTVRTDTLERLAAEGRIDLTALKILTNRSKEENFSSLLSTRLYPEWPFAKFKHTPERLAKDVSRALMAMPPESAAAQAAQIGGWTVPLDYQPIHDLLKELHLSLYRQHQGEITHAAIFDQHRPEIIIIIILFVLLLMSLAYTTMLNLRLMQTGKELAQHKTNLEELVAHRTSDLHEEITQHQAALKRLQDSELRTQFFWNNLPVMNFILDTAGTITALNNFAVKGLGYPRVELVGTPVVDIFYEKDKPMLLGQLTLLRKNPGKIYEWELRKIHKDGHIIWVKETARLTKNHEGQAVILIACQCIDARKKAENALQEANNIINKSKMVAFLWRNSPGWPVEFVSDNVLPLFGYSADEFNAGTITYLETIHPDDQARVIDEANTYSKKAGCTDFNHAPYRIITKDKKTKWLSDHTHIRRDISGAISHYAGVVEDITEATAKEEELRLYRQGLEELVKSRTAEIGERNNELETKIAEIARMNKVFVARELKMVELKERIKALEQSSESSGSGADESKR